MMKKRFMALAIANVMALSLCATSAMAAEFNCTVKGTYTEGGVTKPVISYSYSSLSEIQFEYSDSDKGTWNPETHEYEGGGASGGWVAKGNKTTTIKNHSNVGIDITPQWAAESGFEDVDLTVATSDDGTADAVLTLDTAEGTEVAEAPSGTISFGLDGGSLSSGQSDLTIGTITLKVAQSA